VGHVVRKEWKCSSTKIKSAIKVEKKLAHYIYTFRCSYPDCDNTYRCKGGKDLGRTDVCNTHAHVDKPFQALYKVFLRSGRDSGYTSTINYEDFLTFTEIKECHYCFSVIPWFPFVTFGGKFRSNAYYLDRKDNSIGYTIENCVVCCSRCNVVKSDRFTYEQFIEIGKLIRKWEGR
jgi:hypothetical protein